MNKSEHRPSLKVLTLNVITEYILPPPSRYYFVIFSKRKSLNHSLPHKGIKAVASEN